LFGVIDRIVCNYREIKEETLLAHK
jgi:hypothetical protein